MKVSDSSRSYSETLFFANPRNYDYNCGNLLKL